MTSVPLLVAASAQHARAVRPGWTDVHHRDATAETAEIAEMWAKIGLEAR